MADTSLPAVATAYNLQRVTLADDARHHRDLASGRHHPTIVSALVSSPDARIVAALPLLSIHCEHRSAVHERALIQRRQPAFRSGA